MAGLTTARRGAPQASTSGPPPPLRIGPLQVPNRRRVLLVALALVVLAASGGWLLYGSPWLRVERVRVAGARVLTEGDVREAASVPVGSALISVDTSAIEHRLRERLPRIERVAVTRSWPHTIKLTVTERRPEMLLKKGGKFVEVDRAGVSFATVRKPPKNVPVLRLTADQSPSGHRFGEKRLSAAAVRVARALPRGVRADSTAIRVRSYDSIVLELTGDRTVNWGNAERGKAKAAALTALMKAERSAGHFDVSVPSAPAASGS